MENFYSVLKDDVVVEVADLVKATLEQADELKRIIQDHISKNRIKIVIDLSKCEFVDSTFLSALITSLKATVAMGGNLRLVAAANDVNIMLESTGMFKVFDVYQDVDSAVGSFNNK